MNPVATSPPTPKYPYSQSFNLALPCTMSDDCWAGDRITTVLTSVTVYEPGRVDVHSRFTSTWDDTMDIVFNPWAALRDAGGHESHAWANDGANGYISVPAHGSVSYTIEFGGLSPAPGTTCTFGIRIQQSGAYTMDYDQVTVPCM